MRRYRRRLPSFIPLAKLFAPELSFEDLLCALEALWDFFVRSRSHRVVGKAVHVPHLEAVDEHPVIAREVIGAALERLGMHLCPIARHGTRKVHGIQCPAPRAGG